MVSGRYGFRFFDVPDIGSATIKPITLTAERLSVKNQTR